MFMKQFHFVRMVLATLALGTVVGTALLTSPTVRAGHNGTPAPPALRITPPAPVFDEKERLAELAQRRSRVAQKIGSKAIMILFSTEPRVYANDVDYEYRQENNLYYLTNLKQKGATLVLLPGNMQFPEILFLPRRNPAAETWTGHMYSPQEANEISGIKEIWEASEFEPFIKALRNRQPYRPNAEKILMSELPSSMQLANGNGFEPLLKAAAQ